MKKMIKKSVRNISAVILLSAFTQLSGAAETLKIGVLASLTGPGAPWGLGLDGGVRIAADEVNQKGGLNVGKKNYKIEVVAYDDQYKAASAVVAINRLIDNDNVRFVFGPIGSVSLLAIKGTTEEKDVFLFPNTWTASTFDNAKNIFRVASTTQEFVPDLLKWLKKNRPEIKNVATLSPNDETGWNSQKVQKKAYADAGYHIVFAENFERSQTDFRAILTKLLSKNPDSIELDTVPPATAGLIIRQARDLGFKGQFTKFGGFDVSEIVKTAGAKNAEGVVGQLNADPNSPEWASLKAKFQQFHKNEMGDFVFLSYDAARILFASLEKAGAIDNPELIRKTIEGITPFNGTLGELKLGGKTAYGINRQLYTPVYLTEIKDGKGQVIEKVNLQVQ
jgi:branched-chain amino acid transport system substrate-binding protein